MSELVNLTVNEKETSVDVSIDWSLLTWRDLLAFNKAQESADDEGKQMLVASLVTKLTGQDALDLPALVAFQLATLVVDRLTGKTGPNA
jgi:hypothetical protein